ncbi:MAG: DUF2637 domain-containing protein [Pseudonocardiaceae bacterium]|nr:DUF2637 domain-containing protein [Pseudonocardiaceae bacterium]
MTTTTAYAPDWALRLQCTSTMFVALGAAYISYHHGRTFALDYGADPTTAALWPLIIDGLLTISTIELWITHRRHTGQWKAWLAFGLGIGLSLCANIASAPELNPLTIAVAASPPLALLLAVELLNHALKRRLDPRPGSHTVTNVEQRSLAFDDNGSPDEVPTSSTLPNNTPGHRTESVEAQRDPEPLEQRDPLHDEALRLDSEHWRTHNRPISADRLRSQLRINSRRARTLVRHVRNDHQHRMSMAT